MPAPTTKDGKTDEAAVAAAEQAQAAADAKAAADADTEENHGKLVVLMRLFVARIDAKDKTLTRRYRLGEEFHPVSELHDVESLIQQKVIGRVGDGPLKHTSALAQAQAQAVRNDETSPVVDLSVQPFTQTDVTDAHLRTPSLSTADAIVAGPQGDVDTTNAVPDPTS